MTDTIETKTPMHLWIVGILSLFWNALGAISYLTTKLGMLEGSGMPAEQIEYVSNFPDWASALWAMGVWGCFFGSVALLLRKAWAVQLFGLSIIGLIGTTIYQFVLSEIPESMTTPGQYAFATAIWVITIGLFIYSQKMRSAGVLR